MIKTGYTSDNVEENEKRKKYIDLANKLSEKIKAFLAANGSKLTDDSKVFWNDRLEKISDGVSSLKIKSPLTAEYINKIETFIAKTEGYIAENENMIKGGKSEDHTNQQEDNKTQGNKDQNPEEKDQSTSEEERGL